MTSRVEVYCDDCGELVHDGTRSIRFHSWYPELPWDVKSANKGESGVVCRDCIEGRTRDDLMRRGMEP